MTDAAKLREKTLALVAAKPEYVEELRKLLELDTANGIKNTLFEADSPTGRGFFSEDIRGINWGRMGHLVTLGILLKCWESNTSAVYCLADRESVQAAIDFHEKAVKEIEENEQNPSGALVIPDDIFDCVIGFNDIKDILKSSLSSTKPVSFLLVGPPSSAKTVILRECERIHGARLIVAGTATKVGIRDVLFEEAPPILIIDELDKVSSGKELAALLTWIQDQRVIVTMHGKKDERCGRGQVIAACNNDGSIPNELKSRFMTFYLKPYTDDEFRNVSISLLTKREGVNEEVAKHITESVLSLSRDVRLSINIARLCTTKEAVDKVLDTLRRHSKWEKFDLNTEEP